MKYLTNARSISLLRQSLDIVNEILSNNYEDVLIDMLEIDIKSLWEKLGSIIGETYDDELIDQIFSRFCLGK